jgi:3-hexulose-6-phosphate synthase/6-phospho-3-hexuloisomerase
MSDTRPDRDQTPRDDITFQLSLDVKDLEDAVELARLGADAGVQVIEAGTILILSEGAKRVLPRLRELFPLHPIVADMKCTDGAAPEVGLMFRLGASKVTVMAAASDATIRFAVQEAANHAGCAVMVDTMGCGGPERRDTEGQIAAARRARDLGAHYVVLHLGYDERTANRQMVEDHVLLKWAEAVAKQNLGIPIQVVGGLTMAQAKALPQFGINEIVISMNLGSRPVGDMQYDKITAFSVDLHDPFDRQRVTDRIRQFIDEVRR